MITVFKSHVACNDDENGFSLVELIVSMTITLIILGVAVAVFSSASVRTTRS